MAILLIPATFADGKPILTTSLKQQVTLGLVENTFTTINVNTVTSAESFKVGESKFRLGQAGDQFRTFISGRGNTTGTPAGFVIAGYVVPIEKASPKRGDRLKKIAWLAGCSRKRAPHPSAQSFASVGKVCCSRSGHYSTASEGSAFQAFPNGRLVPVARIRWQHISRTVRIV